MMKASLTLLAFMSFLRLTAGFRKRRVCPRSNPEGAPPPVPGRMLAVFDTASHRLFEDFLLHVP